MPPGGEFEIENVTFCIFNIFNFTSATRRRFSFFPSKDSWSKSINQIFDRPWIDKNIRHYVKNECFGDLCISGTLNIYRGAAPRKSGVASSRAKIFEDPNCVDAWLSRGPIPHTSLES